MAFSQKLITVQFDLANGQFEGGGNTYEASGLRVSAHIANMGAGGGEADVAIYGLPLKVMNQLSTVGTQYLKNYDNGISVLAGDAETGQNVVWTGRTAYIYVDASDMPEVCLRVYSTPGLFQAAKPIPPTSVAGVVSASSLMQKLAGQMKMQFENNGVNVKLSNPYYPGTAWTQALQIAKHGGFDVGFDKGTMVITAPGKSRQGGIPLISKDTGMVGYPTFQQANIYLTALYDPAVQYQGQIQVKSDLTPADGTWTVNALEYDLESQVPSGKWFMNITAYNPQQGATPDG